MPGLNYPGAPAAPPSGDEVFNLTSSPHGGWVVSNHPKAAYYNGKTYFTWTNGSDEAIYIAEYDHSAETVSTPFQLDGMGPDPDTHIAPPVLVRDSDKRIMVAFCLHGGPNLFIRTSTNPEDVSAFGAAVNIDSSVGASDYAYPNLFQLTGVTNDPIYLFYRDDSGGTGRLAYTKSTNGGSTWSARTLVMTPPISTNQQSWAIRASTDRIDVMATDRDTYGGEGAVDVGHMYMDGTDDKWYTSAGVEITASKPFAFSELTAIETNVTGGFVTDGVASANPVFTYLVDSGSSLTAKYARWDGAAWDKGTIYTADHFPVDRYFGSLAINRADLEEVFTAKETGASSAELYTHVSGDLGATWDAGTALTTGSGDVNAAPAAVVNGDASMPVMWLRGTATSSDDFAFGIKGLRR